MVKGNSTEFNLLTMNEILQEPSVGGGKFAEPNPFVTKDEEGEVACTSCRYHKLDLGNNPMQAWHRDDATEWWHTVFVN